MLDLALFCRNEAPRVAGVIEAIAAQAPDLPAEALPLRLFVLENGSSDDTAGVARRAAAPLQKPGLFEVTVMDGLPPGKARSWNTFVAFAESEIIGFHDADVRLAPGALAKVFARLSANSQFDLVGMRPALAPDFQPTSFWHSVFAVPFYALRPANSITGNAYLARRRRLDPVPEDSANEDLFLSLRHEGRYAVEESASVWVEPPATARQFLRQRARIRAADARERQRTGRATLKGHRRNTVRDALAFAHGGGVHRLVCYLALAAFGRIYARLFPPSAQGWVPEAGRRN